MKIIEQIVNEVLSKESSFARDVAMEAVRVDRAQRIKAERAQHCPTWPSACDCVDNGLLHEPQLGSRQFAAIKIRTDDWNNAYLTDGDRVLFQVTDGDSLQDLIDVAAGPRSATLTFAEVGLPHEKEAVTE